MDGSLEPLALKDFKFSFLVHDLKNRNLVEEGYFEASLVQIYRQWVEEEDAETGEVSVISRTVASKEHRLEPCGDSIIGEDHNSMIDRLGIDTFMCPNETESMSVMGTFENSDFHYVALSVNRCTSHAGCKNETEIEAFIQSNVVSLKLVHSNQFVNIQNYTKPVLNYLESQHWQLIPGRVVKSDLFIQENTLTMHASLRDQFFS
jgi:hypothetical protein